MQILVLLPLVALFTLSFAVVIAQENDGAPTTPVKEERIVLETKDKDTPAMKGLKLEKEYSPRLPNGYGPAGAAVTATQRESIYKILTEYRELIDLLKLRIELLEKERDAKMEAVLTPAQQQRLNSVRPARVNPIIQRGEVGR
jgi:hypothetical protein